MNGNNPEMKFIQIFIIMTIGTEEASSLLNTIHDTIVDAGTVLLTAAEFTEMIAQSKVIGTRALLKVDPIILIFLRWAKITKSLACKISILVVSHMRTEI